MGFLDRFRRRPAEAEEKPKQVQSFLKLDKPHESVPVQQFTVNEPPKFTVAKPRKPSSLSKNRVLHGVSGVMILLNVVVGLFFYSNNVTLNAALLGYLGVSTILLGHYFSLTRG
jgi:hypothetical protein